MSGCVRVLVDVQVESRAHSIWGGEEGLLAERQRKAGSREKMKQRKYEKKIKGVWFVCLLILVMHMY